jgi:tetratricopeptide (TPR) repeat protein
MNAMKRKVIQLLLALLLPVLSGCSGMDTIRLGQDKPEDLDKLLQQHEYARVRQLTSKYASLDTVAIQTRISNDESAYEQQIHAEVLALESGNDLLGAVQLLSTALQKIPHSNSLRELRNAIEPERVKQLQSNEQEQLIARARYILNQQKLYQEQANLEAPTRGQRREHKRNIKEAQSLAEDLLKHGQQAFDLNQIALAKTCLQLSQELNQTPEADAMLAQVQATEDAHQQVAIQETRLAKKKAKIKKARSRKKERLDDRKKTEILIAGARQALEADDLQAASAAVVQIPSSADNSSEVLAIREDLDRAVNMRVKKLMATGDAQYRADNVLQAVRSWTEALSLAPDNRFLRDRVERANKVLARLEELKRQQKKKQPRSLSVIVQPTRVRATQASPRP